MIVAMTRPVSKGEMVALGVLVASATSVIGSFVGLPAALMVQKRLRPKPIRSAGPPSGVVSVVVAAHNEQAHITEILSDLGSQDLPPDVELQIIVGSDGSTDGTVELAESHPVKPVVLDLSRGGKSSALNAALDQAVGDIVVFSDANTRLGSDAVATLIQHFGDPEVGGVAGRQDYGDPGKSPTAESEYWVYEGWLKGLESAVGSTVSATGALYAIRRELYQTVPHDVTDDFYISTGVISAGKRLIYEPGAVAWEDPSGTPASEYRRKVRIITTGLTGVWRRRDLLDPRRHGSYSAVFFVHKVMRRLLWIPLTASGLALFILRRVHPVFVLASLGSMIATALGVIGIAKPDSRLAKSKPVKLLSHFLVVNVAAAHAWINNPLRSNKYSMWKPERS